MSVVALHIPSNRAQAAAFRRPAYGFTLLELMLAGAVCALLVAVALPSYQSIVERQKVGQCVRDLMTISIKIEQYRTMHGFKPPMSLADLGAIPMRDPWGFNYRYLNFGVGVPGTQAKIRKDRNLTPINTEFDLYSVGADGVSMPPLTARQSLDDVVWARDGGFVGIATDF
ncbi:MAG: type IV pilin protein [Steroidobacter sp.]